MDNRFKRGGLEHDGGTKDPVSGNDVPIGSTQKEVRDDIPAQLSEGEYVIPADVVRFFGVKFFEELRMKAKDGMELLHAKGQMGNGDEQYVDDDVPFDMEDLDLNFNEGGIVYANKGTAGTTQDDSGEGGFTYDPNNPFERVYQDESGEGGFTYNPKVYDYKKGEFKVPVTVVGDDKNNVKVEGEDNAAPGTGGSGVPDANFNYQYTKNDVGEASKYMSGVKATDQAALDLYDLNKDGKIDVSDTVAIANKFEEQEAERKKQAVEALKITTGITQDPTDEQMSRLDLDGDGQITIGDVIENAGGTRQPKSADPIADIDPVDPVDDKDEEDPVDIQTQKTFMELPYNSGVSQEERDARQRYSFEELMGGYTKPSDFKKGVFSKSVDEAKEKAEEAEVKQEILDKYSETDIGAEGSNPTDAELDALGITGYGFNANTGKEISADDVQAMEQSVSALAGFTQGFTNDLGFGAKAALSVIGSLGGVPGTGPLGTIGGTLNNAAAIYATAQQLGLEVSVLDAIQSVAVGFFDSDLGKQMTANQKEFGAAITKAKNSAIEAVQNAGYIVDPSTGTVIDDSVPSFPNIAAAKAFYSKYGILGPTKAQQKEMRDAAQAAIDAGTMLDQAGLPMDISTIAEFAENMGITATEVAQSVIDQAALGLEPFGGLAGGAPSAAQPDAETGYGSGSLGMTSEEAAEEEAAMSGEQYGGDNDTGPDADSPGTDADTGGAIGAKGGLFTKQSIRKNRRQKAKNKRKGLAARK